MRAVPLVCRGGSLCWTMLCPCAGGGCADNGPYYCAGLLVAAEKCGDNGAVARLATTRKDKVNRANEVIGGGEAYQVGHGRERGDVGEEGWRADTKEKDGEGWAWKCRERRGSCSEGSS